MGAWDLKTTPGYHWEYVNPSKKDVRIRVKDTWKDESASSQQMGLMLLTGNAEALDSRSYSDGSYQNSLYITERPMDFEEAKGLVFKAICNVVGKENAQYLYSISPSDYSNIGSIDYSGDASIYPPGTISHSFTFLLSKDAVFRHQLPKNDVWTRDSLNMSLESFSEIWRFNILTVNEKVITYCNYRGPGDYQSMNVLSPFWGMDSNKGFNYFYNSIEIL